MIYAVANRSIPLQLMQTMAQLLCKVEFTHVKGHQDNGLPMVLSREAWLNIEADLAAKKCISMTTSVIFTSGLPFKPWCLMIYNTKIVKNHKWAI